MIVTFILLLLLLETFFYFFYQDNKSRLRHLVTNSIFLIPSKLISIFFVMILPLGVYDIGILNYVNIDSSLRLVLSVALLDFFLWFQHLLSHKFTILWKLHQVHHCDKIIDISSAARFHPIELFLSMIYKISIVCILGISRDHFILFELITGLCALFTHANIKLPSVINTLLSVFIITPNLHQIHHSEEGNLMNSNYGNFLSIWDRMSGNFIRFESVQSVKTGIKSVDQATSRDIRKLLILPFKS